MAYAAAPYHEYIYIIYDVQFVDEWNFSHVSMCMRMCAHVCVRAHACVLYTTHIRTRTHVNMDIGITHACSSVPVVFMVDTKIHTRAHGLYRRSRRRRR